MTPKQRLKRHVETLSALCGSTYLLEDVLDNGIEDFPPLRANLEAMKAYGYICGAADFTDQSPVDLLEVEGFL